MSISGALNSALSGLNANTKQIQAVSNNLANALTPGYGVRRVELSPSGEALSGGVRVDGLVRDVNETVINDRRRADSAVAASTTQAAFFANLEFVLGTPEDPQSLTARLAEFEGSLITAAARPEEQGRLQSAVLRGAEVAQTLNQAADRVQSLRVEAETQIAQDVESANSYLQQIQRLNRQIADATNRGVPAASFEDQRSVVLDQLAEIVPLRVFQRDNGVIAIYTPTGAGLLDGSAAELSFEPSTAISAQMTVDNGLLSGLEINGNPVAISGPANAIGGGRLAANFALRDEMAVDAQTQLDAIARNLMERFEDPGVDATRIAGDPGLFTDAGIAFDPANEVGLAGRIALSDLVRPETGGDYWRLRDGLFAAAPGAAGDASLLQTLSNTLTDTGALASGDLGGTERGVSGHVAAMMSYFGAQRLNLDQTVAFAQSNQTGLVEAELSFGVNSDDELQRLLLLEQSFAANARMIQTVEEMLDTLLGI